MNEFSVISIPLLAGLLLYLVPERFRLIKGGVSLAVSGIVLWMGYVIYCEAPHQVYGSLSSNPLSLKPPLTDMVSGAEKFLTLNIDNLSKLIVLLICIFAFLVMIYSVAFKQAERNPEETPPAEGCGAARDGGTCFRADHRARSILS